MRKNEFEKGKQGEGFDEIDLLEKEWLEELDPSEKTGQDIISIESGRSRKAGARQEGMQPDGQSKREGTASEERRSQEKRLQTRRLQEQLIRERRRLEQEREKQNRAASVRQEQRSAKEPARAAASAARAVKKEKRGKGPMILTGMGLLAVILLAVYCIMALRMKQEPEADTEEVFSPGEPVVYSQEELDARISAAAEAARAEEAERILGGIRQGLSDGNSIAKTLRPYYPDEVVVATNSRIRFFPVLDTLKKNPYRQENLTVLENGELQYMENGQVITRKGIDVSYHQGEIDWKLVAEDGVEFAFIRAGLRGYGTGKVVVDEQFENNVKGALGNGIEVGVYFYSQSVNEAEVLEEAQLVLDMIAPYKITGPVVYDAEKVADSRTSALTVEERTAMALAFCQRVEEAGYRPMVYLNLDTAFSMVDLTQLEKYDKWFAHYGTDMYYPYDYKIWQYSESGTVNGIDGAVDLNISFESWE